VALEEALKCAEAENKTLIGQCPTHLLDRPVAFWTEGSQHRGLVGIDVMGSPVAAQSLRSGIPLLTFARPPAADAGRTDPEALTSRTMRHSAGDRSQNPHTEIKGKRCRHA
jgi:hypothetical protein